MSSAQYKREIEAIARKKAPDISTEDRDYIESQLWLDPDLWDHLTNEKADDQVVEDIARIISNIREKESYEVTKALAELGFEMVGTGGGCEAFIKTLTDAGDEGPHFLVTDYDCGLPGTWDEEVFLGYYEAFGEDVDSVDFDSVRDLVEAVRKGTAHPKLGGAPAAAPTFVDADLELVNRHRRSLGMGPLDPSAGWTSAEITDMADSIRKTGRMANPKVLPLIEIPSRR